MSRASKAYDPTNWAKKRQDQIERAKALREERKRGMSTSLQILKFHDFLTSSTPSLSGNSIDENCTFHPKLTPKTSTRSIHRLGQRENPNGALGGGRFEADSFRSTSDKLSRDAWAHSDSRRAHKDSLEAFYLAQQQNLDSTAPDLPKSPHSTATRGLRQVGKAVPQTETESLTRTRQEQSLRRLHSDRGARDSRAMHSPVPRGNQRSSTSPQRMGELESESEFLSAGASLVSYSNAQSGQRREHRIDLDRHRMDLDRNRSIGRTRRPSHMRFENLGTAPLESTSRGDQETGYRTATTVPGRAQTEREGRFERVSSQSNVEASPQWTHRNTRPIKTPETPVETQKILRKPRRRGSSRPEWNFDTTVDPAEEENESIVAQEENGSGNQRSSEILQESRSVVREKHRRRPRPARPQWTSDWNAPPETSQNDHEAQESIRSRTLGRHPGNRSEQRAEDDPTRSIARVPSGSSVRRRVERPVQHDLGAAANAKPVVHHRHSGSTAFVETAEGPLASQDPVAAADDRPLRPAASGPQDDTPIASSDLKTCPSCGRKFGLHAFEKHVGICDKVFGSKRKEFDSKKMRVIGTEQASFLRKKKRQLGRQGSSSRELSNRAGKQSKWRQQSDAFREAIRQARKVKQMEDAGVPLSELPPAAPSAPDPSFIPCPHCGRTFNEAAAERHIPKCKHQRAKPTRLVRGGGRNAASANTRRQMG